MLDWIWIQTKVGPFLVKTGATKLFDALLKAIPQNPQKKKIESALSASFVQFEEKNDGLTFVLRKTFQKEKKFKKRFCHDYKAKREEVCTVLMQLMGHHGAEGAQFKQQLFDFIDIFDQRLMEADGLTAATVADMNASKQVLEIVKDIQKKINAKPDTNPPVPPTSPKVSDPHPPSESATGVSVETEFLNQPYHGTVETIKNLIEKEQFQTAKSVCLSLIEEIKTTGSTAIKFWAYRNVGRCYKQLGEIKEASDAYKLAFNAVGPTCSEALRIRALACLLDDKAEEGLGYIDSALAISRNKENLHVKGSLLNALGRFDEAIALYEELSDGTKN